MKVIFVLESDAMEIDYSEADLVDYDADAESIPSCIIRIEAASTRTNSRQAHGVHAGVQHEPRRQLLASAVSSAERDNAVVETLWASLKNELVFQRTFATRQQAKDAIFEWIVVWHNRKRRHSSLGYVSPETFEA